MTGTLIECSVHVLVGQNHSNKRKQNEIVNVMLFGFLSGEKVKSRAAMAMKVVYIIHV